ncbi:MAG: hypothetical protein N3D10_02980 [Candidatus Micrarchaeota archaeon]|nr:hypothetical protein [Candidatus Micrarchaeota archaeon]
MKNPLSFLSFPIKTGIGFGLISGTLTTLGLIVGIYFSTKSTLAIIGGIISIAIADAFSDSLAIHISEESKSSSSKHVFLSTVFTFISKFLVGLIYLPAFLIFHPDLALLIDIFLGSFLIIFYSYLIAKQNNSSPLYTIGEHLFIAFLVICLTYFLGVFINENFS